MHNHPLSEEPAPNIQPEPCLAKLKAQVLSLITSEEISICPSTFPHEDVEEHHEVSPQSPPG